MLIFNFNSPTNPSESNHPDILTERREQYISNYQLKDTILVRLLPKDTIAYQSLDSIPIYSPISVKTLQISSDYGFRIHPIYGDRRKHLGIDLRAPAGTEIKSTACGIVEKVVMSKYGYGNQIIIRHANGYKTRYAHLNKSFVVVGDTINRGQTIALLGKSGLTTGNHLHYEILKDEKPIDPLYFSYTKKEDRSIKNYISTLITLEYV